MEPNQHRSKTNIPEEECKEVVCDKNEKSNELLHRETVEEAGNELMRELHEENALRRLSVLSSRGYYSLDTTDSIKSTDIKSSPANLSERLKTTAQDNELNLQPNYIAKTSSQKEVFHSPKTSPQQEVSSPKPKQTSPVRRNLISQFEEKDKDLQKFDQDASTWSNPLAKRQNSAEILEEFVANRFSTP